MKYRFVLIIWIFSVVALTGGEKDQYHFFGASISGFSGSGITYRYRRADNYCIKFAGYAFYNDKNTEEKDDETSVYDFGLEYQKIIFRKSFLLFNFSTGLELLNKAEPKSGYDKIERNRFLAGVGFNIDIYTKFNPNYPDIVMFFGIGERYYHQHEIKWDNSRQMNERKSKGLELTGTAGLGVEF